MFWFCQIYLRNGITITEKVAVPEGISKEEVENKMVNSRHNLIPVFKGDATGSFTFGDSIVNASDISALTMKIIDEEEKDNVQNK